MYIEEIKGFRIFCGCPQQCGFLYMYHLTYMKVFFLGKKVLKFG